MRTRAALATAVDDVIAVHILCLESGTLCLVDSKQSISPTPATISSAVFLPLSNTCDAELGIILCPTLLFPFLPVTIFNRENHRDSRKNGLIFFFFFSRSSFDVVVVVVILLTLWGHIVRKACTYGWGGMIIWVERLTQLHTNASNHPSKRRKKRNKENVIHKKWLEINDEKQHPLFARCAHRRRHWRDPAVFLKRSREKKRGRAK